MEDGHSSICNFNNNFQSHTTITTKINRHLNIITNIICTTTIIYRYYYILLTIPGTLYHMYIHHNNYFITKNNSRI